ncbi:MAG: hypothetical protein H7Z14_08335 [Anaerolineae bacterium]|nr:hypothetical protein [Phycisphaerae bacterium]
MPQKRFVMRIELTGSAKEKMSELSDDLGTQQVEVMSRLVDWFTRQPDLIQAAVLGRYPAEIEAEVARLILHRTYGGPAPATDSKRLPSHR